MQASGAAQHSCRRHTARPLIRFTPFHDPPIGSHGHRQPASSAASRRHAQSGKHRGPIASWGARAPRAALARLALPVASVDGREGGGAVRGSTGEKSLFSFILLGWCMMRVKPACRWPNTGGSQDF
jgi:hypothetical protein